MENAFKFTLKGGITIKVRVESSEKREFRFIVEDTGIGVHKEDLGKLFKIYEREQNTCGFGTDLKRANLLAKLLNPTKQEGIKVESEKDKGATFSFVIECLRADDEAEYSETNISQETLREDQETAMQRKIDPYAKARPRKGASIGEPIRFCLVVDDNPFNVMVASHLLQQLEFKVKVSSNGQEAIDEMQAQKANGQQPFRLILMDSEMPVMDGFEATRKLRTMMEEGIVSECPIVGLTVGDKDEGLFKEAGVIQTLAKPLDISKLKAVIEICEEKE